MGSLRGAPIYRREASAQPARRGRGAIEAYGSRRGDFADYLILEHAREAGCSAVASFDRALLREPGFVKV
jgi:predicted nucleic-acid-binding protein